MAPPSPSPCPFSAPSMLKKRDCFVGRKDELKFIQSQMTGPQPTSVNIVGPHKIGKSSLLWRFYQICRNHRQYASSRYAVIYLSFQDGECQTENTFYQRVAEELRKAPVIQAKRSLVTAFSASNWERSTFAKAIRLCEAEKILPVLCIDKFEALFQDSYREKFDEGFYDNLHSLINNSALMLVLASLETLDSYRTKYKLTSSFFNVGSVWPLEKFSEAEAQKLVELPKGTIPGAIPALTETNQRLALEWGKQHPVLLQLAGRYLWEAQQRRKNVNWAKQNFQNQARVVLQLPTRPKRPQKLGQWLRWLVLDVPIWVGNLTKRFGLKVDDIFAWLMGLSLIIVAIMCVAGIVPEKYFFDLFKKFLCGSLSPVLGKLCDG
ncbi:AAA-like domain-containing protein [Microcoleus vaginatus]|uniref:AAA-like domain-containing protein n=1 Tax=Microcoleus vaginatus TaxID=119532 RepID=UPI001689C44B|nr:AAA-like domain-containing protein [Microcoleus sp. FACHB-84]MBD2009454.1 AAA-like domain-containing protein [Microcoleus sp. FACHB-45]